MVDLLYKVIVEPARDPNALQRNCWYVSIVLVTWAAWGMWEDGGVWATVVAIVLVSWVVSWILMLLYALVLPLPAFLLEEWVKERRAQKDPGAKKKAPDEDYRIIENPYRRA